MTFDLCNVPMEGLEPPHLAASDPKSDVSTNFTTWAFKGCKSNGFEGKRKGDCESFCNSFTHFTLVDGPPDSIRAGIFS